VSVTGYYGLLDLGIRGGLTQYITRHLATGDVERMNRTIKDATVRRFHSESYDQLQQHLADFVSAYNFGRRLKPSSASHLMNSFANLNIPDLGILNRFSPMRCPLEADTLHRA